MWTLVSFGVFTCLTVTGVSGQALCERLTGDSGSFQSPNFTTGSYENDQDCLYQIEVSSGKVVKLTFTSFNVEEDYDFVYVYDGDTTDEQQRIASLTGTDIPGDVKSSGNFMTVRFVSDESETMEGFEASYEAEEKVFAVCTVGQYRCGDGVTCIESWRRCDGNPDCRDGSDEDSSNCACQDIPSSLSMCRGLEYSKLTLPNPLNYNHTTVDQVTNSAYFSTLSTFENSECHPKVRDLVCATVVPRCEASPSLRQQLPCRSWCEEVKYSCGTEDAWADFPNCDILPSTNCNNVMASTIDGSRECFDGNGANYRGDVAKGTSGADCVRWDVDNYYTYWYPWANLDDNKCRNPNDNDYYRPWCNTADGYEDCDIIPCTVKGCSDPGKPSFGKRSPVLTYYWVGDTVTFTCDTGFKFNAGSPPNKAQCVQTDADADPKWETDVPQCEVDQNFKLQKDLLNENYDTATAPTRSLKIKAYVVNVINLDEKSEKIVTAFKKEYTWIDDRLKWEPKDYGKLDRFFILDDKVWKPTLILERNADTGYGGGFPLSEVKVLNTGEVTWPVEALSTTTCSLDPFLFPQDNMTCAVCWHAGEEYNIDCSSSPSPKDGNFLICENNTAPIVTGEWGGTTTLSANNNTACLTIRIKRDPTYHYSTTISPCLILIILMVITFIMPIDKGDRIGFGVTVLLSMVVSLVVVTGFLPVSSTLPFIAMLIIVCMALMALFMLTTLFIIIIHDKKGRLPKWARTFFLKHMARLLLFGDLTKKLKDDEPESYNVRTVGKNIEQGLRMEDGKPSGTGFNPPVNVKNEVGATLIGLKGSVDELNVSVKELAASIETLAGGGDDEEEVAEYALLAKVLDRLSLVLYIIAIIVAIPCTLLIGRKRVIAS